MKAVEIMIAPFRVSPRPFAGQRVALACAVLHVCGASFNPSMRCHASHRRAAMFQCSVRGDTHLTRQEMARESASERASEQARALYLHSERGNLSLSLSRTRLCCKHKGVHLETTGVNRLGHARPPLWRLVSMRSHGAAPGTGNDETGVSSLRRTPSHGLTASTASISTNDGWGNEETGAQGLIRSGCNSATRARKDAAVQLERGRGALSPSAPLSVVKVEVGRGGGATEASWSAASLAVSPARGRAKEGRPHWTLERARRAAFRAQSKRRCCGRNEVRKGNGTRQTGGHQRAVAAEDMPASC